MHCNVKTRSSNHQLLKCSDTAVWLCTTMKWQKAVTLYCLSKQLLSFASVPQYGAVDQDLAMGRDLSRLLLDFGRSHKISKIDSVSMSLGRVLHKPLHTADCLSVFLTVTPFLDNLERCFASTVAQRWLNAGSCAGAHGDGGHNPCTDLSHPTRILLEAERILFDLQISIII